MAQSYNIILLLLLWLNYYTGPPEEVELAVAAHQWLIDRKKQSEEI